MAERWVIRWMAAWPGAAAIGIANGALREITYGRHIGEVRASRLSGVTLAALLAVYSWNLQRRWPIPSTKDAARIGAAWAALTVAFEFGFGWGVEKRPWREMIAAYNVARGETWPLVLAWICAAPAVVRRLQTRSR
jgi:hypothetical protein